MSGDFAVDLSHGQKQWGCFHGIDLKYFAQKNWGRPFVYLEQDLARQRQEWEGCSVLVLALPFDSNFSSDEIEVLRNWVCAGKGLFLLGYYLATSHHERGLWQKPCLPNINGLARTLDCEFSDNLVMPTDRSEFSDCQAQAFSDGHVDLSVTVKLSGGSTHAIAQNVTDVAFLSACSLKRWPTTTEYLLTSPPGAIMEASGPTDSCGRLLRPEQWIPIRRGEAVLLAAWPYGSGRVVASGTWKICTWAYGDNATLVRNVLDWLAQPSAAAAAAGSESRAAATPSSPTVDKRKLRDAMIKAFSAEELETLCFDVEDSLRKDGIEEQVDLDVAGGEGKAMKVMKLIAYLDRRGRLGYLEKAVRDERPGII